MLSIGRMPRVLTAEAERAFRERLCRVAERQFARLGYPGVTLRALTEELGCSRMTPYRYFADKEAILAAVRASAFARLAEASEAAAAGATDPLDQLDALGRAYLRFAADEPDAYRLMFAFPETPDTGQYAELAKQLKRSRRPMVDAVRGAGQAGLIVGEPDTIAAVLWAGLHGIITLQLADKLHVGTSHDAVSEAMMSVLLRGFAADPAAHPRPAVARQGVSTDEEGASR